MVGPERRGSDQLPIYGILPLARQELQIWKGTDEGLSQSRRYSPYICRHGLFVKPLG